MCSKGDTRPCTWIGMPISWRSADTSISIRFEPGWSNLPCDGRGQVIEPIAARFRRHGGWRLGMSMPFCNSDLRQRARQLRRVVDATPPGLQRVALPRRRAPCIGSAESAIPHSCPQPPGARHAGRLSQSRRAGWRPNRGLPRIKPSLRRNTRERMQCEASRTTT